MMNTNPVFTSQQKHTISKQITSFAVKIGRRNAFDDMKIILEWFHFYVAL